MLKKIISLLLVAAIIAIGYTQKDALLEIVKAGGIYAVFIGITLVGMTVFFPIVPYIVLAGIIGAVFGVMQGILISLTGAMTGTMLMFFLARYGFKDWAQNKLKQYPKIQEYESYLEKNSFMAILFVRLVPIVPTPVVNIVCGLSKVKWTTFFLASSLGKLPNTLIITIAGASFTQNKWLSFGVYGAYMVVILSINYVILKRKIEKEKMESNS
ncbi:TVP38/TMEM64 family protein [Bacillus thuringiensis]|uniref:TVP38/TMEM64 family protein n=1 Tax=Bacillus thuringiensis TaxID=1428 RepID=UPI0021D679EC|nr:TVP38/TMEM64 family protein [Bacillus thuringiensis]MCU7666798.1 TVP38/TMEM64 family protein [Bacillus thuringiensis]